MKLLYLHYQPIDSGMANVIQVLHMCYTFAKLGVQVTLAVPGNGSDSHRLRELARKNIGKEINFPIRAYRRNCFRGRGESVGAYLGIKELLKTQNVDYCFVRNEMVLNATLKYNVPTIFESHSVRIHTNPLVNLVLTRNLVKNCHHAHLKLFIAISHRLAQHWVAKGVPSKKVIVLHDGVDTESFKYVPDVKKLRKQLGLPTNRKLLVYAGSLYKDRGIESIPELAKRFREVLFVVVGGPEESKRFYEEMCKGRGISNIVFTGRVSHQKVKQYLFAADVLLMIWSWQVPTINYCSPLKMFEYMAAERIIVGHAFPTILEVLKDGEHAYLADPNSFDDLCKTLGTALRQSYPNTMAKKARELAINKYNWQARAKAVLAHLAN